MRRAWLVLLIALFPLALSAQVLLPKTGQSSSDFGKDWPVPRFVDNNDGTITDMTTGLMWLQDAGCLGKQASPYDNFITALNTIPGNLNCDDYTASHNDWRMPTMPELASLLHAGQSDSLNWLAAGAGFTVSAIVNDTVKRFWTSDALSSTNWYVDPTIDNVYRITNSNAYWLWAVRVDSSVTPTSVPWDSTLTASRFTDNANGTFSDSHTGLIWMKDANCLGDTHDAFWDAVDINGVKIHGVYADTNNGLVPHTTAVTFPSKVNGNTAVPCYGGGGWRLPTRTELLSLINTTTGQAAYTGFLTPGGDYWSSTKDATYGWVVNFGSGRMQREALTNNNLVILVKGGFNSTYNLQINNSSSSTISTDLPEVKVGEASDPLLFTLRNSGTEPQPISKLLVSGSSPGGFTIANDNCSNTTLAKNSDTCTFELIFSPNTVGWHQAELAISYRNGQTTTDLRTITMESYAYRSVVPILIPRSGQLTNHATGFDDDAVLKQGVPWPNKRFKDNGDGTLKDRLTGLVWLKDVSCLGSSTFSNLQKNVGELNSGTLETCEGYTKGTYSDWRIPNILELISLFNANSPLTQNSWLTSVGFVLPNNWDGRVISSTFDGSQPHSWDLTPSTSVPRRIFSNDDTSGRTIAVRGGTTGLITHGKTRGDSRYTRDDAWYELGEPDPSPRTTNNNDGTTTDNLTGLMWIREPRCMTKELDGGFLSRVSLKEAFAAVKLLNTGPLPQDVIEDCHYTAKYTDWRLPNLFELATVIDYGQSSWLNLFSGVSKNEDVWTSNTLIVQTVAGPALGALTVGFDRDFTVDALGNLGENIVFFVRGGLGKADVALNPLGHDFGNISAGTNSSQTFTVQNNGDVPVPLGEVESDNDAFTIENDSCVDSVLNKGESCTFDIVFSPAVGGAVNGKITVFDDLTATVSGVGIVPKIVADPTSQEFGTVTAGLSGEKVFTIKNEEEGALTFSDFSIGGADSDQFEISANDCKDQSVAKDATCTITVAFKPTSVGAKAGTLEITSNDPLTPTLSIALSGTANTAGSQIAPGSNAFASTKVGSVDPTEFEVTVTSTGDGTLVVSSVSLGGTDNDSFTITDDGCKDKPLAKDQTCTIKVQFTPTSVGALTGELVIASNDATSPSTSVDLSGTGVAAPALKTDVTDHDFGTVAAGASSDKLEITLTSFGSEDLVLSELALSDSSNYKLDLNGGSNPCGSATKTLKPGESCTVTLVYAPTGANVHDATLTIKSNHSGGDLTLNLTGKGNFVPNITVDPDTHDFGSIEIGKSDSITFTISNTLLSILTISSIELSAGTDFTLDATSGSTGCGSTTKVLAQAESCTVTVQFAPSDLTAQKVALTIKSNDPDTPTITIDISGVGFKQASLEVNPTLIDFGTVSLGSTSNTFSLTLSNSGSSELNVSKVSSLSGQVVLESGGAIPCGAFPRKLAPNAACTMSVRFSPTQAGLFKGTISVESDDAVNPAISVELKGVGVDDTQGDTNIGTDAGTDDTSGTDKDTGSGDTTGGNDTGPSTDGGNTGSDDGGGGCSVATSRTSSGGALLLLMLLALVALRRRSYQ